MPTPCDRCGCIFELHEGRGFGDIMYCKPCGTALQEEHDDENDDEDYTEFTMTATSVLTMQHIDGNRTSTLKHVDIDLDASDGIDISQYFNEKGLPNEAGVKSLTLAFVQGLVANIQYADEEKIWDKRAHLEYVTREIGRALLYQADISPVN